MYSHRTRAPSTHPHSEVSGDPESLERINNELLVQLGSKVGLLHSMTHNIHAEADGQHRLLHNLTQDVSGVHVALDATRSRFLKVFDSPQKRNLGFVSGGIVILLFLLYLVASWR